MIVTSGLIPISNLQRRLCKQFRVGYYTYLEVLFTDAMASLVYTRCDPLMSCANLIRMNHELLPRCTDNSVLRCGPAARVIALCGWRRHTGPTWCWSYWWQRWAHNNWSGATKRSVTDCPLLRTRVDRNASRLRARTYDKQFYTRYISLPRSIWDPT